MHLFRQHNLLALMKIYSNVRTATFSLGSTLHNKDNDDGSKPNPSSESTNQWITIYQFPYIHAIVGLNKLKIYQAAITSGGIPLTMFLESANIIPAGGANVFAVLGNI